MESGANAWRLTIHSSRSRFAARLNSGVMRSLVLMSLLLLASCSTGRVTYSHNDCDLQPIAWSRLPEAPSSSEHLASLAGLNNISKHKAIFWFRDRKSRLLLCLKDTRRDSSCDSSRWVFVPADGTWTLDKMAKEAGSTLCVN